MQSNTTTESLTSMTSVFSDVKPIRSRMPQDGVEEKTGTARKASNEANSEMAAVSREVGGKRMEEEENGVVAFWLGLLRISYKSWHPNTREGGLRVDCVFVLRPQIRKIILCFESLLL
ncbi:hypothetical protein BHE74_00040848 [Ensete ventricosum]|nr:hypothetical protein GW17_00013005 [Ensete ventricosum]RWW52724.1 hypothetical protein BHE74_00040848 [Ensete ventricosum]RZS17753.1 hypothetical protein BHM03_00049941 [Ensete ventricosum]